MKFTVLMGSPKHQGNTAEICKPFLEKLRDEGVDVDYITLYDKNITPCSGCYACQDVAGIYGCILKDDVEDIMTSIMGCDCLVLATPIYTWYCTAPMKALLDRHYGLNKYYGTAKGSLWEGKKLAIIATHGYEVTYATEPFVQGMERLCAHSNLTYCGMYSVRHEEDIRSFQTAEAVAGAKAFALQLIT